MFLVCFANSHAVWSQRGISVRCYFNFFFHNSNLEYIAVAVFVWTDY